MSDISYVLTVSVEFRYADCSNKFHICTCVDLNQQDLVSNSDVKAVKYDISLF